MRPLHYYLILASMVILGRVLVLDNKPLPGPVTYVYCLAVIHDSDIYSCMEVAVELDVRNRDRDEEDGPDVPKDGSGHGNTPA